MATAVVGIVMFVFDVTMMVVMISICGLFSLVFVGENICGCGGVGSDGCRGGGGVRGNSES